MAVLTIAHMMQAYAQDAVDLARDRFETNLDFSEGSVSRVEHCLAQLHDEMPSGLGKLIKQRKTDEYAWHLAQLFGGYLGEVMRRRWGGEWSTHQDDGGKVVLLKVLGSDVFPVAKVYQRLVAGAEDGIVTYYQVLRRDFARIENSSGADELFESELRRQPLMAARMARRPPPVPSR